MKFCPECGTRAEGFKFCPECGYKLTGGETAAAGAPKTDDIFGGAFGAWLLNRIPLLLLRILFAFLLIGAGLFSIIRTVSHGVFA